ncbi:hypothetical protein O9929_12510 [Vibrio lentus]|nr:hypothetical protein [Vibrio lentus]
MYKAQGDAQGVGRTPVSNSDKDVSNIPPYDKTTVYVRGAMNNWTPVDDWAMEAFIVMVFTL